MAHRQNAKTCGTHTTCSDLAARVIDIAAKVAGVESVSLGYLAQTSRAAGTQRVKFTDLSGAVLLTVRSSGSVQELRVFCANLQETRTKLAGALRDNDIAICFK